MLATLIDDLLGSHKGRLSWGDMNRIAEH